LTAPSTRSAEHQTRILLPLATPAGGKEGRLVGLADEGDGHHTLIWRAPDQDGLSNEPPPEGLVGDQPGRPFSTVWERQSRGNHQAEGLRRPDAASSSFPTTTAGRGRGQPPPATAVPGQGLIRGPAGWPPPQRHPKDSEEEYGRASTDLAPEIRQSPCGVTPSTGTGPTTRPTIYRGSAGTSPPPRSAGVAGELSFGSGRRDERSSQLQ
jgi:hypothetical protein